MHQDILINITNSVLRCLNLTHSYSGMYCQDLAVYIRKHDFSMIYQGQTSHAASCKCISRTGTSSSKAEYCDLRPADFFYACVSHKQFHTRKSILHIRPPLPINVFTL